MLEMLLVALGMLALMVLRPARETGRDTPIVVTPEPRPLLPGGERDRPTEPPPTDGCGARSGSSERGDATARVYELRDQGEALPVIAAILNAEGYRTDRGTTFSAIQVWDVLGQRRRRDGIGSRAGAQQPVRQLA